MQKEALMDPQQREAAPADEAAEGEKVSVEYTRRAFLEVVSLSTAAALTSGGPDERRLQRPGASGRRSARCPPGFSRGP